MKKLSISEQIASTIFIGGIIAFMLSFAFTIVSIQQLNQYTLLELAVKSINKFFLIVLVSYVIYQLYFEYLAEPIEDVIENIAPSEKRTEKGEIIIDNKLFKKFKTFPEKMGFYQTTFLGEKVYDVIKPDLKTGTAIISNKTKIVDITKYTNKDNYNLIKSNLGLTKADDYLTFDYLQNNQIIARLKDPFGTIPFNPKDLRKGKILIGYDIDLKPYYIDINKMIHQGGLGGTGSGKSTSIYTIMASVQYNIEYFAKIYFNDLKNGASSQRYSELYNGKIQTFKTVEEVCSLIEELHSEMVRREIEYVNKGDDKTSEKPIFVINDEWYQYTSFMDNVVKNLSDEEKLYYRGIDQKLSEIITRARASKIFLWFWSQGCTVEHYPAILRDNLPSKFIAKSDGYYQAFLPEEKAKELNKYPNTFGRGTFVYVDASENTINYIFLKTPLISDEQIIELYNDRDRITYVSNLYANMKYKEYTEEYKNNEDAENKYYSLVKFFEKNGMLNVDKRIVNEYFARNNLDSKYWMEEDRDYNEEYMELMNEFIEYSETVKDILDDRTKNLLNEFIEKAMNTSKFNKQDVINLENNFEKFRNKYKIEEPENNNFKIELEKLEKLLNELVKNNRMNEKLKEILQSLVNVKTEEDIEDFYEEIEMAMKKNEKKDFNIDTDIPVFKEEITIEDKMKELNELIKNYKGKDKKEIQQRLKDIKLIAKQNKELAEEQIDILISEIK